MCPMANGGAGMQGPCPGLMIVPALAGIWFIIFTILVVLRLNRIVNLLEKKDQKSKE